MPALARIPLAKLVVVQNVTGVAVGRILQIEVEDGPAVVALRCERAAAGGPIRGLVPLEAPGAGTLWADAELPGRPAIDITDLTSTVLLYGPPPRHLMGQAPEPGGVYRAADKNGAQFIYMAVTLRDGGIVGYARLDGGQRGRIETTRDAMYLGKVAVVPRTDPLT